MCKCGHSSYEERRYSYEHEIRPSEMERIKDMTYDDHVDCDNQLNEAEDKILKQAKRIEELEAEVERERWIPVSERLPKNVATVFILTGERAGGVGFYGENEKKWERLDHAINLNITHWKPIYLPQKKS